MTFLMIDDVLVKITLVELVVVMRMTHQGILVDPYNHTLDYYLSSVSRCCSFCSFWCIIYIIILFILFDYIIVRRIGTYKLLASAYSFWSSCSTTDDLCEFCWCMRVDAVLMLWWWSNKPKPKIKGCHQKRVLLSYLQSLHTVCEVSGAICDLP